MGRKAVVLALFLLSPLLLSLGHLSDASVAAPTRGPVVGAGDPTTLSVRDNATGLTNLTEVYIKGQSFTINITVEDVTDLFTWEIGLEWDPAVLECTNFTEGPFLKTGGATILTPGTIDNTTGRIDPPYACTLIVAGVSGSGTLAHVDFRVKDYGVTPLSLTIQTHLIDSIGEAIAFTPQPAWFGLTAPYPTAVIAYTPPAPLVNETITFNATASRPARVGTQYLPITSYAWDFGDGNTTTRADPVVNHTYTKAGVYVVNLTVTAPGAAPESNSTTADVAASLPQPPWTWVYVWPPSLAERYKRGENFTVEVRAKNVTNLWKWKIGLEWDPAVLECLNLTEGPLLKTGGETTFTKGAIDNTVGRLWEYVAVLSAGKPVSASGTLAYVDFRVKGYGLRRPQTWLNLTGTRLENQGGQSIGFNPQPGWFRLTESHPTASFTYSPRPPLGPFVNLPVTFDASGSGPAWNGTHYFNITSYAWDFGDGNTTTVADPVINHTYTAAGNYTVSLTVTAPGATPETNSTTDIVAVLLSRPVAKFTYSPLPYPLVNQAVAFNASSSERAYNGTHYFNITSYAWDFGDGNTTTVAGPVINHTYTTAKTYTVNLTVTAPGAENETDSTRQNITVYLAPPRGPVANFTYTPTYPIANETVTFNASLSQPGHSGFAPVNITSYKWDFGDGNTTTVTDPEVRHVYLGDPTAIKTYYVNLTVTAPGAKPETNSTPLQLVKVYPPPHGPTASFTWSPPFPLVNQTVTFDASASGPGKSAEPVVLIANYTWDFGDGNTTTVSSPQKKINHTYAANGTYRVNLTVTCKDDPILISEGLTSDSTWRNVTVLLPRGPTASFTWSPPSPTVGKEVTFNASASGPGYNGTHEVPIANYTWDFGDGTGATTVTAVTHHTYAEAKNYTVTLTVTCDDPVLVSEGLTTNSKSLAVVVTAEAAPRVPMWIVVVVVAAVVVAAVAVYLLKFR